MQSIVGSIRYDVWSGTNGIITVAEIGCNIGYSCRRPIYFIVYRKSSRFISGIDKTTKGLNFQGWAVKNRSVVRQVELQLDIPEIVSSGDSIFMGYVRNIKPAIVSVILKSNSLLPETIYATYPVGWLLCLGYDGQHKRRQNTTYGDDHKQFD